MAQSISGAKSALTVSDLNTTINHEPRVSHIRLAEVLGYAQPNNLARLIERHREPLERFGEVSSTVEETTRKGGRPGSIFWLSKRQALYITTKAETEFATEATIQMVEVFDAWTRGELQSQLPAPEAAPALSGPLTPSAILSPAVSAQIAERAHAIAIEAEPRIRDTLSRIMLGRLALWPSVTFAEMPVDVSVRPAMPAPTDPFELAVHWACEILPQAETKTQVALINAIRAALLEAKPSPRRVKS